MSDHVANHHDCARSPFRRQDALFVGAVWIRAITVLIRITDAPECVAHSVPTPTLYLAPDTKRGTESEPLIYPIRAERRDAPRIDVDRTWPQHRHPRAFLGGIIRKTSLHELTTVPGGGLEETQQPGGHPVIR